MKKWAVILGIILIILFLITWGTGFIPGMIGELSYNVIALIVGIIVLVYGLIKK